MSGPGASENMSEELRLFRPCAEYFWTRELLLRSLGLIYLVAFACLFFQAKALFGDQGLLPREVFLESYRATTAPDTSHLFQLPTVFWWLKGDLWLSLLSLLGLVLSAFLVVGWGSSISLFVLWALQLSFMHVGQTFYSFGWEILLLEVGFLAVFLASAKGPRVSDAPAPSLLLIIALRWVVFRLMLGAGLIKLRGDPCWTELSCLQTHYETQPNPHPLSWWIHQAPDWFHQLGVLINHFVELVVPFGLFGPRRLRHFAGACTVLFQGVLILSGNLSFLNWLTIVVTLICFDDSWWRMLAAGIARICRKAGLVGQRVIAHLGAVLLQCDNRLLVGRERVVSKLRQVMTVAYILVVLALSLNPLMNFLGPRQHMNRSYEPFHLVNSYGAFGSVGRERLEIIIEGTDDAPGPEAKWKAYEFPCKAGAVDRAPCVVTPYHHRLAWQMWFAAQEGPSENPWLVHLAAQLLENRPEALKLVSHNPFVDSAPLALRMRLFRYRFTGWDEAGWWKRDFVSQWMRPVTKDDPELDTFLRDRGFR
jgi:hypothetical protein